MDIRNGKIINANKLSNRLRNKLKYFKRVKLPLTEQQIRNGKIGKNDLCPCGSGKKFKKCCLNSVK